MLHCLQTNGRGEANQSRPRLLSQTLLFKEEAASGLCRCVENLSRPASTNLEKMQRAKRPEVFSRCLPFLVKIFDRWEPAFICIFQTCLALKRAGMFSKHFRGERGCVWHGPSAHPGMHFATRTLRCKRACGAGTRYASLGLFLSILWARGTVPGWPLVRYLCKT